MIKSIMYVGKIQEESLLTKCALKRNVFVFPPRSLETFNNNNNNNIQHLYSAL